MSPRKEALEVAGTRLTSPDRVLYREQGITKRALAGYYEEIAERVLPELRDRPLTLVRCPRGRGGECFVQRRASESFPDFVHRVPVEVEGESEGEVHHVAIDSLRGLIHMVQIGVLEIHTWGARRDRLDRPDRIVFDLDPGPSLPFAEVGDAARRVRDRLGELGLESYVKTTGGKGLHVVVPLVRTASWEEVGRFSRVLAEELAREEPDRYVAAAAKSARKGKVYVDYLRNGYGSTAVAAYSTRSRPGAPVSTPLAWEELTAGLRPDDFTVLTVPDRLRRLGRDPWAGYGAARQRLTARMRAAVGAG